MSAYAAVVLEHFRRPRNRGRLDAADVSMEGANPLCGDRIRLDLRMDAGTIAEATFTADACALCVASASLLTEHVRGMSAAKARELGNEVALAWVGAVPAGRTACVVLPVDTLRRALRACPDE
ncbi:MAG TPA: iron-sulfur cluster assembly scaffold protein [Gemmatimonadaceae bacterium]